MTEQEGKNEEEVNFNTILKKYKNLKHKFEEDEINGENNEEVKEALETYKANAIKKINEMKKTYKDEIKERIKNILIIINQFVICCNQKIIIKKFYSTYLKFIKYNLNSIVFIFKNLNTVINKLFSISIQVHC